MMMPLCIPTAILSALVAPVSTKDRALKRFDGLVSQLAHANGVLVVDGDNTRGKSGFSLSHEALLGRTARWAQRSGLEGRCIVLIDHGSSADAFHMPQLGGTAVAFSGPDASADDVAARDVAWFQRRGHDVMLVTADSGLIQRCRKGPSGRSLIVAPPQALLAAIGHDSSSALPALPALAATAAASPPPQSLDETHLTALEAEMRARAAVTRADRAHQRVARNAKKAVALQKQRKALRTELETTLAHSSEVGAPSLDQVTALGEGALEMGVQQQWLDTLVARRKTAVRGAKHTSAVPTEHTCDRVVLAERLRRRLRRRQERQVAAAVATGAVERAVGSSPSARYVAMLNGENQRDEQPATAAAAGTFAPYSKEAATSAAKVTVLSAAELRASTRAEVAQLVAAPVGMAWREMLRDSADDSARDEGTIEPLELTPTSDERMAVRMLRVSLRDGVRPIEDMSGSAKAERGGGRRERQRKRRHAQVGIRLVASHRVAAAMERDAISDASSAEIDEDDDVPPPSTADAAALSTPVAARSGSAASRSQAEPLDVAVDVARLLVVSDTHGHEATLTHVGAADVVVHCGDFAPDFAAEGRAGSRSGEGTESREHEDAAARLDEWLSRLEAPTKLVLRGNHDPPVAAFPLSGATYVTSVSQFEAAGLSFTLVPYCKGPLRGKLPPSDVLVSHVPPKRVLDRATGGEEAGDDSLRTAVRRATRKPRLWLFGHIHEGAGAARVRFGTRADPATVLVNAANANPGIARRLIQGPVMIEVEMP
jgi:Icc-related predicted phosphoesterase